MSDLLKNQLDSLITWVTRPIELFGVFVLARHALDIPTLDIWKANGNDIIKIATDVVSKFPQNIIVILIVALYYGYRSAVRNELELVAGSFEQHRKPVSFQNIKGSGWIKLIGLGLAIELAVLLYFSNDLVPFCIFLGNYQVDVPRLSA